MSPVAWAALVILVLAAAWLRAAPLVERPLSLDEALTWKTSERPVRDLLAWKAHPDHPPLSFLLVRAATRVAGTEDEWAVRLPSWLAAVLCVPIAFLLGRMALSVPAGLLLAALVAFDPVLVAQGGVARMYSLLVLLFLTGFAIIAGAFRKPDSRLAWVWLGIVLAAAAWTHVLGLLLWGATLVAVAATPSLRRARSGPALALAVALALSAPGVTWVADHLGFWSRTWDGDAGPPTASAAYAIEAIAAAFAPTPLGPALILLGMAGLALLARRSRGLAAALAVVAVGSLVATISAAGGRPHGVERYLVPFRLVTLTGLAVLVGSISRRALRLTAAAAAVASAGARGVAALPEELPPEHRVGALSRALQSRSAAGDAVLFHPAFLYRIGEYYRIPLTSVPRDDEPLPAEHPFDRTWVIFQHPRVLQRDRAGEIPLDPLGESLLAELAERYGVTIDRVAVARRLAEEGAIAVGVDRTTSRLLVRQ